MLMLKTDGAFPNPSLKCSIRNHTHHTSAFHISTPPSAAPLPPVTKASILAPSVLLVFFQECQHPLWITMSPFLKILFSPLLSVNSISPSRMIIWSSVLVRCIGPSWPVGLGATSRTPNALSPSAGKRSSGFVEALIWC